MGHGVFDRKGGIFGADFIEWYSASRLFRAGAPAGVYDMRALWNVEKSIAGAHAPYTPFPYPPTYLLIVAPLARLPYLWALGVWSAFSLMLYAGVVRRIEPRLIFPALAFPGLFLNLLCGQNGCLTLAFLGTGLVNLDRSAVIAGISFGLVTYKPQFALLVPVLLLATRRWRVAVVAAMSFLVLVSLSLAIFGWSAWIAFFHSLDFTRRAVLENGGPGFDEFQSAFAAARLYGLSTLPSYAIHATVGLLGLCLAGWVWRRTNSAELRSAAFVTTAMLVTPHILHYDLVVLALPLLWLTPRLQSWPEFVPLIGLWYFPLFTLTLARNHVPMGPVAILTLLVLVVRATLRESPTIPIAGGETYSGAIRCAFVVPRVQIPPSPPSTSWREVREEK